MKPDEELKQTFKIFIDKNDVIHLVALKVGKDSEDIIRVTELIKKALEEIFNKNPQKGFKVLIDLSPITLFYRNLPTKARKLCYQVAKYKQMKKIAIIVPSLVLRVLMKFVITAARFLLGILRMSSLPPVPMMPLRNVIEANLRF